MDYNEMDQPIKLSMNMRQMCELITRQQAKLEANEKRFMELDSGIAQLTIDLEKLAASLDTVVKTICGEDES